MKKTLPLGFLALVAVVTLTAWKGGCGRPDHRDPAAVAAFVTDRLDGLLDDVDATPAQRTQLQAIKDRVLASAQQLRGTRQATHEALLAEWKAEKVDRAKVHALIDARAEEMKAMAHEAADAAIEAHDALTPAQREKLAKKVERMHGRH
jgi:Spy/CpxP family protein refolding chaperone